MRISDWSADVCSSDLCPVLPGGHRRPPDEPGRGDGARRHNRRRGAALPAPARRAARAHRPSLRGQPPPPVPGRIALQVLLTREANTPINQLIDDEQPAIDVEESAEEVARQFSDHDWISAPVVDDGNILL